MGIFSAYRLLTQSGPLPVTAGTPSQRGIRSPWSEGQLKSVVWADLLDTDLMPVTRAEAMKVPSVVKARRIITSHLAGLPLFSMRGPAVLPPEAQPTFLYRTSGASTPWHRMAWTLDDQLFYGWSLWGVERGADDAILDGVRVPPEWWHINDDNKIEVNGNTVDPATVILFPGATEGLLDYAAGTIRAALNIERSWAGRVRNPVPITELHQTTDDVLEPEEITALLEAYTAARRDPNGAVVYTPPDIELKVHGEQASSYLVEARNAVRLDVANMTGLPAGALDGSLSTASLTYTTEQGTKTQITDALREWYEPIEARLSQDDVVPRGQRVRFDRSDLAAPVPSRSGPTVED